MPGRMGFGSAFAQVSCDHRPKMVHPAPDGLIGTAQTDPPKVGPIIASGIWLVQRRFRGGQYCELLPTSARRTKQWHGFRPAQSSSSHARSGERFEVNQLLSIKHVDRRASLSRMSLQI